MKKKVIILIALCCLFIQAAQSDTLSITDLRTEQLTNPLGLDTLNHVSAGGSKAGNAM